MNRTRMTFFIVLGVVLGIVALSLALQLLASTLLLPVYVAATIFSVGVVSLDFLGILGQEGDDGGVDGDVIDGEVADGADFDADVDGNVDADAAHGVEIEDTDFDAGDETHVHALGHLHDIDRARGSRVLQILAYLRMTVYFCLGFGPTGWVAYQPDQPGLASLGPAILVGVLALILASAFFRFQRSDTDSSLQPHELLRAQATVTIPLSHTTMGRVRVHLGMNVTEQYALAAKPGHSFHSGDTVQITHVTDECVYVV